MSPQSAQPGPGGEARPPSLIRGAGATSALSLVIGRALGSVVVTVDGELNVESSEPLARVLSDLIDGQGNLAVAVDLGKAIVDPEAVTVFAEAAKRASERGAKLILAKPPIETYEALRAGGYADLVEVFPRAEAGGQPSPGPPGRTGLAGGGKGGDQAATDAPDLVPRWVRLP